jgi:hypothetical protein
MFTCTLSTVMRAHEQKTNIQIKSKIRNGNEKGKLHKDTVLARAEQLIAASGQSSEEQADLLRQHLLSPFDFDRDGHLDEMVGVRLHHTPRTHTHTPRTHTHTHTHTHARARAKQSTISNTLSYKPHDQRGLCAMASLRLRHSSDILMQFHCEACFSCGAVLTLTEGPTPPNGMNKIRWCEKGERWNPRVDQHSAKFQASY